MSCDRITNRCNWLLSRCSVREKTVGPVRELVLSFVEVFSLVNAASPLDHVLIIRTCIFRLLASTSGCELCLRELWLHLLLLRLLVERLIKESFVWCLEAAGLGTPVPMLILFLVREAKTVHTIRIGKELVVGGFLSYVFPARMRPSIRNTNKLLLRCQSVRTVHIYHGFVDRVSCVWILLFPNIIASTIGHGLVVECSLGRLRLAPPIHLFL